MVNLRTLNKEQLKTYFRSLGEEPNPLWTKEEIVSRVLEIKKRYPEQKSGGLPVPATASLETFRKACLEKSIPIGKWTTKGT